MPADFWNGTNDMKHSVLLKTMAMVAMTEAVLPYFDQIRYHVDKLELIVDDELWPLPKYREILFSH